ncbi:CHASE3 domain-containing protein [Methylobacterium sp. J-067]|uniref:adenylate/guanylate cyclase domain-containing protein n=1 Tax=Methylobacterium sp. J-067 TaxID=2836648 RepID=UPI001FBA8419|nr:CHASE3 domain-containing protein [Methylobacterium sp. J-067]MCJ2023836.1 CHASE3 domain-containing protein [Methylobacterium sp. J-067]
MNRFWTAMLRFTIVRSGTVTWMSAGFAALILMTAFAVAGFLYQQHGSDAVRHTIEVDGRLARALSALQDAETGQRGYVISGDEAFLAPFLAGRAAFHRDLDRLRDLVRDNPEQLAQLDRLRDLAARFDGDLDASVALRRSGDAAGSARLVREGQGKRTMDAIRALIREMEAHEAALLDARQALVSRIALAIWITVAALVVLLVVLAASAIREAGRRANLARFLPEELSDRLADEDDSLRAGRRQNAAVAFVDMRGSTALAETLDPHALSQFLTAFRRRVMRVARLRGGVVDKFIGDGALIVFGLPEPRPDDAARALAFARDLVAVIERWNARSEDRAPIRIGVGIHYGDLFCGIIGEDMRLEFTVLGDTVNVAARLEQATKTHGVPILVSEAVLAAAGDGEGVGPWREVSRAPLRGRTEAMAYLTPAEAGEPARATSLSIEPGGGRLYPVGT